MSHTLIIDQGTHASRCMVFSAAGKLLHKTERDLMLYRHDAQKIEHHAIELLESVQLCLDDLEKSQALNHVKQCALVTQRSSLLAWDKQTGDALSAVLSWQDTRGAELLTSYHQQATHIKTLTGLPVSPHYGASKMRWLLENIPSVKQAAAHHSLIFSPIASYLLQHIAYSDSVQIDYINASRTQLFNIHQFNWSAELLQLMRLDTEFLPQPVPCESDYGVLRQGEIPVSLVTGDQSAALYANGMPDPDQLIINIGSGAFVLRTTGDKPVKDDRLLTSIANASHAEIQYLLEGTVNGAGTSLALLEKESAQLFDLLPDWLQTIQQPPVFINTIGGLGSPWWNAHLKPFYIPAKQFSLAERAVATVESICFMLMANIELITTPTTVSIRISGGLSRLDGLCQKLANLSQLAVIRIANHEATARGAAWLLTHGNNRQSSDWETTGDIATFTPSLDQPLQQRYQVFRQHVDNPE